MTAVDVASVTVEKLCRRCDETKPVDEFHRHNRSKDGRHEACKTCEQAAAAEPKAPVVVTERRFLVTREPWQQDGLCRGITDLFFTERGEATKQAKAVCQVCPVQCQCLEFAIRTVQKFGVWGGTSERERRKLRRQQRAKAAVA